MVKRRFLVLTEAGEEIGPELKAVLAPLAGTGSVVAVRDFNGKDEISQLIAYVIRVEPADCPVWIVGRQIAFDWVSLTALVEETEDRNPDLAYLDEKMQGATWEAIRASPLTMIASALRSRLREASRSEEPAHDTFDVAVGALESGQFLNFLSAGSLSRFFVLDSSLGDALKPGISWPVRDEHIRVEIFGLFSDLGFRCGHLGAPYTSWKTRAWFIDDAERWIRWFSSREPAKILHVCGGDGLEVNVLLDAVFPHPESSAHVVTDLPPESEGSTLVVNPFKSGRMKQLHLYEGLVIECLAWMIAEEGFWESFDFILLTCAKRDRDVLTHLCLASHLLRPGGILVIQSDHPLRMASSLAQQVIQAFSDSHLHLLKPLHASDRVIFRSASEPTKASVPAGSHPIGKNLAL
jgi:hypothetical protein